MKDGIRRIEIFGQNDEYICVHGDGAGNRGVYLAEDGVDGIYDAPEKQTWKSGARQPGSKQKNRKILARDMDLMFMIKETRSHTYEQNESYLMQAIGFELDPYDDDAKYARLALTTDLSGVRFLDVLQYEQPDFGPKQDSIMQQYGEPILKLRSGQPDWYELHDGNPFVTTYVEFTESGWGEIEVENPTNRPMLQKWVCTQGKFILPDVSWKGRKGARFPGGKDQARTVTTPTITDVQGGLRIDLDRSELMARDFNDTNVLALFSGQFFMYPIPPYTQKQVLPVYAEIVPEGGARVELRQPLLWSRPWGLEHIQ